jgi:GNAT superfamily N-acetyltransferase
MKYRVVYYNEKYKDAIVDLILPIQQNEFKVPITIKDQPDLQNIPLFYQKGNGNFWVAIGEDEVVGTIALIDFGDGMGALRKMFVHRDHRGKKSGVAQLLLNELRQWCKSKSMKEIFLGTIDSMHAAHRFYEKNGFSELLKSELPEKFPLMKVDNKFFRCSL